MIFHLDVFGVMLKAEDYEAYTYKLVFKNKSTNEKLTLNKGKYTIHFEYTGKITEKTFGFYCCVDPRFLKKHFDSSQ